MTGVHEDEVFPGFFVGISITINAIRLFCSFPDTRTAWTRPSLPAMWSLLPSSKKVPSLCHVVENGLPVANEFSCHPCPEVAPAAITDPQQWELKPPF